MVQDSDEREDLETAVRTWRFEQFIRLGFTTELSSTLAQSRVDLSQVRRLIQSGCPAGDGLENRSLRERVRAFSGAKLRASASSLGGGSFRRTPPRVAPSGRGPALSSRTSRLKRCLAPGFGLALRLARYGTVPVTVRPQAAAREPDGEEAAATEPVRPSVRSPSVSV